MKLSAFQLTLANNVFDNLNSTIVYTVSYNMILHKYPINFIDPIVQKFPPYYAKNYHSYNPEFRYNPIIAEKVVFISNPG